MFKTLGDIPQRVYMGVIVLLVFAPLVISIQQQPFYLDLLTRVLILAIAAVSLNLIVGYGGMVSLGHAAYLGIGAYCVGIPAYYEVYNGFLQLGLAISVSAIFALITGAICLRTSGVYFIMITLAFTQMLYFVIVSLDQYGADDGLVIFQRSEFGGIGNLENPNTLYYVTLAVLLLFVYLMYRLINARFGRVIVGIKHNETRMEAFGYNTYRYKLVCYVISGTMCGIAGFFLGNFTNFISPEMMDWTQSGELLFMVVIGGTGVLFGPVIGVALFLFLAELLSGITVYWHLIFGILLVALVLFGKGGVHGFLLALSKNSRTGTINPTAANATDDTSK